VSCGDKSPKRALLEQGVALFNQAQFHACHEVLEELWNKQSEPEKQFTQGVLQIAVATHHYQRGNLNGAIKLYRRGLMRIRPFAPAFQGIDVDDLISQTERALAAAENEQESLPFLPTISFRS
jgi:uncharacterized protein